MQINRGLSNEAPIFLPAPIPLDVSHSCYFWPEIGPMRNALKQAALTQQMCWVPNETRRIVPASRGRSNPVWAPATSLCVNCQTRAHMSQRLASCSCGQLTAQVFGEPVRISICHCLSCQRRTGSVFAQQARFRREQVSLSGISSQFVRVGDEGSRAKFHFCPHCGATVYYELEGLEDYLAIPVGAFADPGFPAPTISVYESRMHSWVIPPLDAEHIP